MLQQDIDRDGRRDLSGFAVRVLGLLVRQGKEMRPVLLAHRPIEMLPEGEDDTREDVRLSSGERCSMNWLYALLLTAAYRAGYAVGVLFDGFRKGKTGGHIIRFQYRKVDGSWLINAKYQS